MCRNDDVTIGVPLSSMSELLNWHVRIESINQPEKLDAAAGGVYEDGMLGLGGFALAAAEG